MFPLPGAGDRDRRRDAARALLRTALSTETGTPPGCWDFGTEPSGRPRIIAPSLDRMRFSVSVGHEALALAVSERLDVGIDIEPLEPVGSAEIPWSELTARGSPARAHACKRALRVLRPYVDICTQVPTGESLDRARTSAPGWC